MKKTVRNVPNSLYALAIMFFCGLFMLLIPPVVQLCHYAADNAEYAAISDSYRPPEQTPVVPVIVAAKKENHNNSEQNQSMIRHNTTKPEAAADLIPEEAPQRTPEADLLITEEILILSDDMGGASAETLTEYDSTDEAVNKTLSQENGEKATVLIPETTPLTKETECDNGKNSDDDKHNNRSGFEELKGENKDFIAWISVPGTPVDYPVVQSNDTDYYLNHLFTGAKSKLGCLFSLKNADYKQPGRNIAIYGHHLSASDAMFSSLLNYKNEKYYQSHPRIQLNSLYHNSTYRIFAALNMKISEWDPATVAFQSDKAFLQFVNRAIKKTKYDTGVNVTEDDKILTLITCDRSYGGVSGRFIVMAVLEE